MAQLIYALIMITKILKFSTRYCGPCKALAQSLLDFKDIPIESIDADDNEELCDKYNIKSVPTMIFLNDKGEEVGRNVGLITLDKLREKINEL